MSKLKTVTRGGAGVLGVGAIAIGGFAGWAKMEANAVMNATYTAHDMDFPIPFPLSEAEITDLRAEKAKELAAQAQADGGTAVDAAAAEVDPLEGVDLDAIALQRAAERGDHYVHALYACVFCHGEDFGGGVMMDDPLIGHWMGPNISKGGLTKDFTAADWDKAVRHGVLPGGKGSMMPVGDFKKLSNHELSDIICYIRSLPPSDKVQPKPTLGPLGTVLVATGKMVPDVVTAHSITEHPVEPPTNEASLDFGKHISNICTGCHRANLAGGPLPFGPPDWPPAANLTPSDEGLAGWSFDDFNKTITTGIKPDGVPLRAPMSEMPKLAKNWTDTERRALWMYLQSLPATPTNQ